MTELSQEMGKCDECGVDINLAEAWRVDYCQKCFEKLDL